MDAFLSHQSGDTWENSPQNAIDRITDIWNRRTLVHRRYAYSFLALDLGAGHYLGYKINLVRVYLRIDCCRERFRDVQVNIGNVRPTHPSGK